MLHVNIARTQADESTGSHDVDPARLKRIADELAQISRMLSANPIVVEAAEEKAPADRSTDPCLPSVSTLRMIIRHRRVRDKFFSPELFADPAWDILLDLLAAQLEGQRVSVSSLSIAAAVPATTALRWIAAMTEQGLLIRESDPHDGRRIFVALSERAIEGLGGYFARIAPVPVAVL